MTDIDLAILPPATPSRSPYLLVPLLEERRASGGGHLPRVEFRPDATLVPLREELRAWVSVVSTCADACLVLDGEARVVALSRAASDLVGADPVEAVGRRLVGDVLALVDFSSAAEPIDETAGSIPPVSSARAGIPCHGLMRLRRPDALTVTLDTVSTPLHGADGQLLGSLTFFARVAAD